MDNKLEQFLGKLTRQALIGIMWDAMSTMQGYNGHSMTYCIVTAMGGEAKETETGGYRYTLPTIAAANKRGKCAHLW